MKYNEALDEYIDELYQKKYEQSNINRKKASLKNWLSYVIAMFHPGVPDVLLSNTDMLKIHQKTYPDTGHEQIKEIEHFINNLKVKSEKLVYLNLFSFFQDEQRPFTHRDFVKEDKSDAIISFCRTVGFSIKMSTITEKLFHVVLGYLDSIPIELASSHARNFFIFCFDKNLISFNPYKPKRPQFARVFEPDFIGDQPDIWHDHLKDYIHYLRYERNFSAGGIHFKVCKLKLFTIWLDSQRIKEVNTDIIQRFLEKKRDDGVKERTVVMHLKTIKHFLHFLVEKNRMKNNPALSIRIKECSNYKGDTLTESEINRVIEYMEDEIYKTEKADKRRTMISHFLAIRDLCIIQMIIFTAIRLSEVSDIKLNDIDFERKLIRIAGKGNREYRKKIRDIFLNDHLWIILKQYIKIRDFPGQEYLWTSFNGVPMTNAGIRKIIPARIKQAGIDKKISTHRLRATCASLYVKKGMDPLSLKTVMGHNSIATTIDHYTELTEDELRSIWKKTNPLAGKDDE